MHWGNFMNFSYNQKQDVFASISSATISPKCKMVGTTTGTTKQALKPSQISTEIDAHRYMHSHTITHQWYKNFLSFVLFLFQKACSYK